MPIENRHSHPIPEIVIPAWRNFCASTSCGDTVKKVGSVWCAGGCHSGSGSSGTAGIGGGGVVCACAATLMHSASAHATARLIEAPFLITCFFLATEGCR